MTKKGATPDIASKLKLVLTSYGLKTNQGGAIIGFRSIPVADLYLDCRGVVEKGVKGSSGSSKEFQDGVLAGSPATITSFHRLIEDSIPQIKSRRIEAADPYAEPYVICFLCAHGVHRSVASKWILSDLLKKSGYQVEVK